MCCEIYVEAGNKNVLSLRSDTRISKVNSYVFSLKHLLLSGCVWFMWGDTKLALTFLHKSMWIVPSELTAFKGVYKVSGSNFLIRAINPSIWLLSYAIAIAGTISGAFLSESYDWAAFAFNNDRYASLKVEQMSDMSTRSFHMLTQRCGYHRNDWLLRPGPLQLEVYLPQEPQTSLYDDQVGECTYTEAPRFL